MPAAPGEKLYLHQLELFRIRHPEFAIQIRQIWCRNEPGHSKLVRKKCLKQPRVDSLHLKSTLLAIIRGTEWTESVRGLGEWVGPLVDSGSRLIALVWTEREDHTKGIYKENRI